MVEELADRLESESRKLLAAIDRRGGMLRAIETGWVQHEIADSAYRFQLALERGERTIVGVNAFVEGAGEGPHYRADARIESRRKSQVREFRAHRDAAGARRAALAVAEAARSGGNTMPSVLAAVKQGATLGEISDALQEVFGVYKAREGV